MPMIEARVFVNNLADARNILKQENAELQGMYAIHDTIYRNADESVPLSEEFLRLREIPENIWDEKPVILALKQTKLRKVGKSSLVLIKLQFSKRKDAEKYYEENFKNLYVEAFSFRRVGWQYLMPTGDVVDLEVVEDKYPSIEFKSETDDGIERLLGKFAISDDTTIRGPSVLTVRELLGV